MIVTIEGILEEKNYPALMEEAAKMRLKLHLASNGSALSPEAEHARLVMDELKHLIVLAFDLSIIPE